MTTTLDTLPPWGITLDDLRPLRTGPTYAEMVAAYSAKILPAPLAPTLPADTRPWIVGDAYQPRHYREHRDYLPRGGDYFTEGVKFERLVERAEAQLADVDFDTFVATGLSGSIPGSVLAYALSKHLLVIRKDDDTSTHSSRRDVGVLGRRWVFLDDFMSSGRTFKRVWDYVEGLVDVGSHTIRYDHLADETVDVSGFTTDFVGAYLYDNAKFKTPEEIGRGRRDLQRKQPVCKFRTEWR